MPIEKMTDFSITSMQVLDEHGNLDQELEPKIEPSRLVEMYRVMKLARQVDERALKLQRQGRIGTFAPSIGQEAASAGAVFAMEPKDWLVSAFRELAGWLARGMPVESFFLYYNGYEEANLYAKERRILPISIIVGSQLPHAVGLGYALQYRNEENTAVVAFMGDGATSQGDFHEALNLAGLWKAPVVFVCQNNHWAISIPVSKQSASRTLAQKAIAYDITGVQVDGNDILGMYVATRQALERAKNGEGPTFIEAVTYRTMMHTTSDDPNRYRSEKEVTSWWNRDPIPRFRKYLQGKGLWDEAQETRLGQELDGQIEQAVGRFEAFRPEMPDAPFEHVFGTRHAVIEAQRREFLRQLNPEDSDG